MKNVSILLLVFLFTATTVFAETDPVDWTVDVFGTAAGSSSKVYLPLNDSWTLLYRRNASMVSDFDSQGLGVSYHFSYLDLSFELTGITSVSDSGEASEETLQLKQDNYDRLQRDCLLYHEYATLGIKANYQTPFSPQISLGLRQATFKATNQDSPDPRAIVSGGIKYPINKLFGELIAEFSVDPRGEKDYQSLLYGWQSPLWQGADIWLIDQLGISVRVFQLNYFYNDYPVSDLGAGLILEF